MCGGGAAQGLVVLADVTGRGRESNTRVTEAAAVSRRICQSGRPKRSWRARIDW